VRHAGWRLDSGSPPRTCRGVGGRLRKADQLRVAQGRFDLRLKNDFLFWTAMSLGQPWVPRSALNEYTTLLSASIERVADWEDRLPPPSPGDENRLQCGRDQAGIQLELRSDVRSIFAHKQREAVKGSQENAYETLVNSDSWVAR